jgi:hypothetical protein
MHRQATLLSHAGCAADLFSQRSVLPTISPFLSNLGITGSSWRGSSFPLSQLDFAMNLDLSFVPSKMCFHEPGAFILQYKQKKIIGH